MLPSPAPYSNTDEQEVAAITILEGLLLDTRVKCHLEKRDKTPNFDGYVELVDENSVPLGKLEVQVRKLPDNMTTEPKIQCQLSLVSYSEITCNPFLLIGVEVNAKKAYWIHLSKETIAGLKDVDARKTIMVRFPKDNIIDTSHKAHIEAWTSLVKNYQIKLREYDSLNNFYIELSKGAQQSLGVVKEEFREMHYFLDKINELLDGKFALVKEVMYPGAWKVGLAYHIYSDKEVGYTLYPIDSNRNDVQIKETDTMLVSKLIDLGFGFTLHALENPIKQRPSRYAIDIIEAETKRVLQARLLKHENEFLAKEFIFAFIDHFLVQLGLEQKDDYTLDEIEGAFSRHLPLWIDEALKLMISVQRNGVKSVEDCMYRRMYLDPDMLISQLKYDELKQINQNILERMLNGTLIPYFIIGSEDFPIRAFAQFLSYLRSNKVGSVKRPYMVRDYSRLQKHGGLIYNVFSAISVEENLRLFFNQLEGVYSEVMSKNFPELERELPLFGDASRVVVVFNVKESYGPEEFPIIKFYFLQPEKKERLQIDVYASDKAPSISHKNFEKGVELEGKHYRLLSIHEGVLDFIFRDTPMLDFIYDTLEDNFKNYFARLKEEIKPE